MEDKYSNAHNETTQRRALDGKQEVVRYAETNEHSQPQVHFDPAEERRIVRKIDCYIVPLVSLLYLFCFIDRTNIGNARLANLEKDLNLRGYDFNLVLSVFYISYALFEIPTTMACKWIGPGWFIPGTTLGFGILTIAFAFVTNRASACGVRFLLGIFEAGMLPGIAYYLSRWYRRAELSLRLATYLVMAPLAGAFGGLLASGILSLSAFGSTHTWQMIFAIEGIITIGLALLAFLFLTDRPETARWLTESEKRIAIARIKSERIGATKLLDKIDTTKLLRGILNPVTIVTACIFFLLCIFVQGFAFFAPTIIRTIYPTRSVVYQQIMTVPPYLVGSVFALLTGWLSTKTDRRNIFLVLSPLPVVIGYSIFLAIENARVRYGALFIIVVGAFNGAAFCFALVAANVVSDTARSSAIGFTVMWGNIGGLVATWTFLPFDGPNYPIGNGINLAAQGTASLLALGLGFWMVRDNKRRKGNDIDALLGNMDEKEIEDLDWHHPGFVWRS